MHAAAADGLRVLERPEFGARCFLALVGAKCLAADVRATAHEFGIEQNRVLVVREVPALAIGPLLEDDDVETRRRQLLGDNAAGRARADDCKIDRLALIEGNATRHRRSAPCKRRRSGRRAEPMRPGVP